MCVGPLKPNVPVPQVTPISAPGGPEEDSAVQAALLRRRQAQGLNSSIRNVGGQAPLGRSVLIGGGGNG